MSMPLHPSEATRLGDYELLGRLGRGGMGTVYLGRAPDGRTVAIKVIRAELSDDEMRRRFRSEVNRLRQVPSFSTAAVLDADVDHDPAYLVVEYVDGPSLASVVRERGPLSPEQLRGVAIGITTALCAIHGAGVIHRDLKPENVLLPVGGVKVIDFGIARTLDATSLHTRTDQMVGTVSYMAPERFASDGSTTVTPAADIFAWGVMVAYAATGRTPFGADSPPATAMRILTQPPNLSGLTQPIRGLVERALAKEPAQRPTARQLLDALLSDEKQALSEETQLLAVYPFAPAGDYPVAPPPGAWPSPPRVPRSVERLAARTSRRRKRNAFAAAGGAVALTAAAILGLAVNPDSGQAGTPRTNTAVERGGVAAAASGSPRTNAAPAPVARKTTPQAMLELLAQMFPDRKLLRASTAPADEKRLFVQVLMSGDQGLGRMAVEISRDKNPDSEVRTTGPRITVQRPAGNCIQNVIVVADWDDGTHVEVTVSTCLPWNGSANPESPPPLTVPEAKKVASDPRWGVTMDGDLVTAGAKHFPDLITLD
ncbi:serine/threonine-protein kinase [Actinoplanes sp. NPDC049265]|uniref:serine/threonine-protein kinase n=1 Tax=Actinoplanes sp. NPDC049265 TaxID=3363902 RepID=UPI0037155FBB